MESATSRVCVTCSTERDAKSFQIGRPKGKPGRECWVCYKPKKYAYQKKWNATPAGRESHARARRKHRYGLSDEMYAEMLVRQDGKCAICRTVPRDRALDVDHDHGPTKKVRGLLCRRCNRGLGEFQDDRRLLSRACAYLGEQ